jgi:DeoR/GlpR family transcriptional regulator of sugar metabolism
MKSAERLLKLQEFFSSEEFIDAESLSRRLHASDSTIRRDLMELEARGILRRVHGGAISLKARDEILDLSRLSVTFHEEKVRIGRAAAALVKDAQTVILGTGSTVVEVSRNLFGRPLQIITNSIPAAQVFWDCKSVEVTLTGGYLYPRVGAQLGPICEQMLSSVSADLAILGVAGISDHGLSDSNTLIMGTVRKMIERARKVVIVADRSKFGRDVMVKVADLTDVDVVVSDSGLSEECQGLLRRHSIECVLA